MNKPASKEPSMDEILSSIRQIIADEDEPQDGGDTASNSQVVAAPVSEAEADQAMMAVEETAQVSTQSSPEPENNAPITAAPEVTEEPFSLSPDQMVADTNVKEGTSEIDGIDFSPASPGMDANLPPSTEEENKATQAVSEPELVSPEPEEIPVDVTADLVIADDIAFDDVEDELEVETISEVEEIPSAMPDPNLSADIADKLLEPATTAAVGNAFAKLGALSSIGAEGLTLDAIVREMLRPMLKEWLDENLPATVERMVEKEIERVSRGS